MAKKQPQRKTVHEPEVIDVGAEQQSTELAQVREDGNALAAFIKGIGGFMLKAGELEKKADALLATAAAFPVPKSKDDQEALRAHIRKIAALDDEIETQWSITSTFHQMHRRLVAFRDRKRTLLQAEQKHLNRLDADYTAVEQRRAREEEERINREREDAARAAQQREAAKLDDEAVKREEAMTELSEREQHFVTLVVDGSYQCARGDSQAAAKIAGFKDPFKSAARLMSLAKIQTAIKAKREAAVLRQQAEAKRVGPTEPQPYVEVKAEVVAGGTRTTWSGELLDENRLMTAFLGCDPKDFSNRFGIPAEIWTVSPKALNEQARKLHEQLDRWPGVRAKKTTGVL